MRKNEKETVLHGMGMTRRSLWDAALGVMDVQPSHMEGQTFYEAHENVRIAVVLQTEHVFWGVIRALMESVKREAE